MMPRILIYRYTISLNDDLPRAAKKYSKATSTRALVEEALAAFIAMKADERRRLTYKDRLRMLRGKTTEIHLRSDTRNILREDRESR